MNVLKCRPPDNRNPLPPEVDNCRPFFERQFEILRPEYIVCVGTVAAQALLETTESVGKLRGRFHRYRGSRVLVTYHPSYLLRNPSPKSTSGTTCRCCSRRWGCRCRSGEFRMQNLECRIPETRCLRSEFCLLHSEFEKTAARPDRERPGGRRKCAGIGWNDWA